METEASPEAPLYQDKFLTVDPTGIKGNGASVPLCFIRDFQLKRLYNWHTFFKPVMKFVAVLFALWVECQGLPEDSPVTRFTGSYPPSAFEKFMFYAGWPIGIVWLMVTAYKQLTNGEGYNVVFYNMIGRVTRLGDYTKREAHAIIKAIEQAKFLEERHPAITKNENGPDCR